jgi:hypothetical protein
MFYKATHSGVSIPGGIDPVTREEYKAKHYLLIHGLSGDELDTFKREQVNAKGASYYMEDEETGLPIFISHGFRHAGEIYVTHAKKLNAKGVHTWYAISSEEEFDKLVKERPHMMQFDAGIKELRRTASEIIRGRTRKVTTEKVETVQDEDTL